MLVAKLNRRDVNLNANIQRVMIMEYESLSVKSQNGLTGFRSVNPTADACFGNDLPYSGNLNNG